MGGMGQPYIGVRGGIQSRRLSLQGELGWSGGLHGLMVGL